MGHRDLFIIPLVTITATELRKVLEHGFQVCAACAEVYSLPKEVMETVRRPPWAPCLPGPRRNRGLGPPGHPGPRRIPDGSPRGVCLPPRICCTRLSAVERRLARRVSRLGSCAVRLGSWVAAFRRGPFASRGGWPAPKSRRRKI